MSHPISYPFTVYIDADACPVKEETYKVAHRYHLKVILVSNRPIRVPLHALIETKIVGGKMDAADDWIVEQIKSRDILITGDIPLADRALKKGAKVLGHKGKEFTEDSIGDALATREILSFLRDSGEITPHQSAFEKKDRSQFLMGLDRIIQSLIKSA